MGLRVIEDNGKIKLIEIGNPEIATEYLFDNNPFEKPTLVYLPNGSTFSRGSQGINKERAFYERRDSVQPISINTSLDYALSNFRNWVLTHEKWNSRLKERGVSKFDYLSGVRDHEVEGNFEEDSHIGPRFIRFGRGNKNSVTMGEIHIDPLFLTGIPKRLARPIIKNFLVWLSLNNLTHLEGRLNDHIENIERGSWDSFFEDIGRGIDYETESWRGMAINALQDYYCFLKECLEDTKSFIESFEEYRS